MLPRARLLVAGGFSVLMFDFQAHGESTGGRITLAAWKASMRAPRSPLSASACRPSGSARSAPRSVVPLRCSVRGRCRSTRSCSNSVYSEIGTAIANRIRAVLPIAGAVVARPLAWLFEVAAAARHWRASRRPSPDRPHRRGHRACPGGGRHARMIARRLPRPMPFSPARRSRNGSGGWKGAHHVDLEAYAPDEYRSRMLSFFTERLRQPR